MFKLTALALLVVSLSTPILPAQTPRTVTLNWTASVSAGVTGYNVYKCTGANCTLSTKINLAPVTATTYTDIAVSGGATYNYAVTAIDATRESARSNTATAVITPDLLPPTGLTTTVVTVTVTVTGP